MSNSKYWPRKLSDEDLKIITSWNCAADEPPEVGMLCEYRIIAPNWGGPTCTGIWTEIASQFAPCVVSHKFSFQSENGVLFCDQKYLFWRVIEPPLPPSDEHFDPVPSQMPNCDEGDQ